MVLNIMTITTLWGLSMWSSSNKYTATGFISICILVAPCFGCVVLSSSSCRRSSCFRCSGVSNVSGVLETDRGLLTRVRD